MRAATRESLRRAGINRFFVLHSRPLSAGLSSLAILGDVPGNRNKRADTECTWLGDGASITRFLRRQRCRTTSYFVSHRVVYFHSRTWSTSLHSRLRERIISHSPSIKVNYFARYSDVAHSNAMSNKIPTNVKGFQSKRKKYFFFINYIDEQILCIFLSTKTQDAEV